MTHIADHIKAVKNMHVNELANIAGCASPDSNLSAGADFLDSVRANVLEAMEANELDDDRLNGIASEAPDVETHTVWSEFVDLGAYREDVDVDPDAPMPDMEDLARFALDSIAARLAHALATCDECGGRFGDEDGRDACACDEAEGADDE